MPASASLSALALGEGDVEGEWRHSQETRFHCRETRSFFVISENKTRRAPGRPSATFFVTAETRSVRRIGKTGLFQHLFNGAAQKNDQTV